VRLQKNVCSAAGQPQLRQLMMTFYRVRGQDCKVRPKGVEHRPNPRPGADRRL